MGWGGKQAEQLSTEILVHDDGVRCYGGTNGCFTGMMGSGKSTLICQLAQNVYCLPECSKDEYLDVMHGGHKKKNVYTEPETVIYRAREYDHWSTLIEKNWIRSYPQYKDSHVKPVSLFVHADDDLLFCYKDRGKTLNIPNIPEIQKYRNAYDLILKMKEGHINVVYEPTKYSLTPILYKALEHKRMAKIDRDEDRPIKPSVFWYELIHDLLKRKQFDYYTVFIDEFHDVAEAHPQQDMWHLQDILANSFLSLRKQNISFYASTHDYELVDYRIVHRFGYWIYLRGSTLPGFSKMYQNTITKLERGEGAVESRHGIFGKFKFDKIFRQQPIVYCINLKEEVDERPIGEKIEVIEISDEIVESMQKKIAGLDEIEEIEFEEDPITEIIEKPKTAKKSVSVQSPQIKIDTIQHNNVNNSHWRKRPITS